MQDTAAAVGYSLPRSSSVSQSFTLASVVKIPTPSLLLLITSPLLREILDSQRMSYMLMHGMGEALTAHYAPKAFRELAFDKAQAYISMVSVRFLEEKVPSSFGSLMKYLTRAN